MVDPQIPAGFIATLETRNFTFEAHGSTEDGARFAMGLALRTHAQEYGLARDWAEIYEITFRPFLPGFGFRDGAPLNG